VIGLVLLIVVVVVLLLVALLLVRQRPEIQRYLRIRGM